MREMPNSLSGYESVLIEIQAYILREVTALSVLLGRAVPGPQTVERAAKYGSHALLL